MGATRQLLLQWHGQDGALTIRRRSGAILIAILAGFAVALIADWLVNEHLAAGTLAVVLPEVETVGFPIHAVWQRNQLLSPKVRHGVDLLAKRFLPDNRGRSRQAVLEGTPTG